MIFMFVLPGLPAVLIVVMFFYGWTNFSYMREVPRDAMVIEVTGRQWAWSFKYPNGKRTSELVLAYDKPVKLELRSLDVIHGFFIPAFRIKEDVVPGKENYTWFAPTQFGSFDIECTTICGVGHATMLAKAVVIPHDRSRAQSNCQLDKNSQVSTGPKSSRASVRRPKPLCSQQVKGGNGLVS